MKFRVSTTIPTGTYENIKTEYEGEISERSLMIDYALEDLKKYNKVSPKKPEIPEIKVGGKIRIAGANGSFDWTFDGKKWTSEEVKK